MYFDLTEEQKLLRDSLDAMLSNHVDGVGIIRQIDEGLSLDRDLWRKTQEMGLCAILVPENDGGVGMDLLTLAVIAESLGYSGALSPLVTHNLVALAIALAGTEEQKTTVLPELVSGEKIATIAINEGAGQWQPGRWAIAGDTLTGTKTDVINAQDAGYFLTGIAGGGLALVEREATGVKIEPVLSVDGTRSHAKLILEETPCTPLPGADAGLSQRLLDALCVMLAADACGAARRCAEMAVEYAKTRYQFDRPIGSFQGLKHQLANMVLEIEPCRPLYWYAAHALYCVPHDAAVAASRAQAHVPQIAVRAGRAAVEAHGGIGFTWEYPLHIWLKRAMFDYAYLGAPLVQRSRVAELLGW